MVKWVIINKMPSGKLRPLIETVVCVFCTRSEELRLRAKVAIRQTDIGSIRTPNLALDFSEAKG